MMPQFVHLRCHRRAHARRQPGARALAINGRASGGAPPFGQPGSEHLGGRQLRLAMRFIKAVHIVRLPKVGLERLGFLVDPAQAEAVAEDDRPGPDAGEHQPDHHHLDDQIGLHEQGHRRQQRCRRGDG